MSNCWSLFESLVYGINDHPATIDTQVKSALVFTGPYGRQAVFSRIETFLVSVERDNTLMNGDEACFQPMDHWILTCLSRLSCPPLSLSLSLSLSSVAIQFNIQNLSHIDCMTASCPPAPCSFHHTTGWIMSPRRQCITHGEGLIREMRCFRQPQNIFGKAVAH